MEVWVDAPIPPEGAMGVGEGAGPVKPHPLNPHNTETSPEERNETDQ